MEIVTIKRRGALAVIKLARDVINALNQQLVDELSGAIRQASDDAQVRGVVLSSASAKFFSIGLDIPYLFPLSRDDFEHFYKSYNRMCLALYTLPKPTIVAIPGHAIAGGCILALCCDYRFIAEGRKLMGLNEIKLGVPVPYVGDCILRDLVGQRTAREMTDSGEFYESEVLLQMSVVDNVVPARQLEQEAGAKALALGEFPPKGLAMIKRNRVESVAAQITSRLAAKEEYFIECWYADETRARLAEAMVWFESR